MRKILKSKSIFDSVNDKAYEGYVVINQSKIEEVGKGEIDSKYLSEGECEIMDLGDKTVLPGLCDPHIHLYLGAINMATVNLSDCRSEEEAVKKIYDFYKNRDDEWCLAFGWTNYKWPDEKLPEKHSLDKYFPDRPVLAFNDEIHAIWINSKAMEVCGIDKDTIPPVEGSIFKDEDGNPTGYLLELPTMKLVSEIALAPNPKLEKELIKEFLKGAHERGITAVADVQVLGINKYEVLKEIEDEGELDLRVFFSPPIEMDVKEAIEIKENYCSDRLSFLGLKGFIDGVPLGYTGYMVEDYTDRPGYNCEPYMDIDWLKEKAKELYGLGISMRLHSCGDNAVRSALDAIEGAQKIYGNKDLRNTIEHLECTHPDDLDRFKDIDVIASIQPSHMMMDDGENHPIYEILGRERGEYTWLNKTLVDHGATVTYSTDYPIVDLQPMETMYRAITRRMENELPVNGFNSKEKVTLENAIKGITIEPAKLMKSENKFGSLEKGKYADITVLDKNIFDIKIEELTEVKPEMTIFEGEIVYKKK